MADRTAPEIPTPNGKQSSSGDSQERRRAIEALHESDSIECSDKFSAWADKPADFSELNTR